MKYISERFMTEKSTVQNETLCVIHPGPRRIHHSQVTDIPQTKPHRSTSTLHQAGVQPSSHLPLTSSA